MFWHKDRDSRFECDGEASSEILGVSVTKPMLFSVKVMKQRLQFLLQELLVQFS